MYTQPATNTIFTSIGGVFPVFLGGAGGVGYRSRSTSNILVSAETLSYTDQEILISLSRSLNDYLSIGAEVRQVSRGLSKVVPGYEGLNGSGNSLGLSFKYTFNSWLEFGLVGQDMGGKISYLDGTTEDILPNYIFGTTVKIWGEGSYFKRKDQDLRLNLDLGRTQGEPLLAHLGLEWLPVKYLALRAGADQTPKSASEAYTHITAGMGIIYNNYTFDYALYRQGDPSGTITNYFSFGYSLPREIKAVFLKKAEIMHFSDVPPGYWAKKPIEYMAALGIMDYSPEGTFMPDRPVSRAEAAMLLARARGLTLPKEKKQMFSDVPEDFWAAEYIQSARESKLVLGYPDGTFQPRKAASRIETAVLLSRFEALPTPEAGEEDEPFADVPYQHWGISEVLAAKEDGLFDYIKGTDFSPDQGLTRAELAAVLFRTRYAQQKMVAAGLISSSEAR